MKSFEIIARWIYEESSEPISEIEWLLEEHYNSDEKKLLKDYEDVIKHKKESEV
tara:strand:+ start:196 stop:357 length:162 start_codon:yes stop_codon:yes gene_type:complete